MSETPSSYTIPMTAIRLTFGADEEKEIDYVLERLVLFPDIQTALTNHKNFVTLDMVSQSKSLVGIVKDLISSVILTFYKFNYLKSGITADCENNYLHSALFGALLSFDLEQEAEIIERELEPAYSFSLKSIFEFRHEKLKASWQNIIMLANRLLSQSRGDDDIYDIIFFLLTLDSDFSPKVRIECKEGKMALYSDDRKITIPHLTGNKPCDALIATVRERPGSIVIADPEWMPKELIATIRRLGEGN